MKKISILGSTGSIGKNAVELIKANPRKFKIIALVAKNDYKTLAQQALLLEPLHVVIENQEHFQKLKSLLKNLKNCQVHCGFEAINEVSKIKCDLVISAIVGAAGMLPTLEAIQAGSNIALANKESLVCGGKFLLKAAKKSGAKIIPVDSEHNAIYQIFEQQNLSLIDEIILTASGGPFFGKNIDFKKISVEQALKHPNWSMGAKISIDSATMMNKGLEMIEAFHLFPVKKEQIKVLVHPQSIIHGLVNYSDGSTLAMMSLPDMKVPISHALAFPNRMKIAHKKLNLGEIGKLEFFAADEKKFSALKLCREAMENGENAPVILNAANEIAVARFLNKEIRFDQITKIVAKTLDKIPQKKVSSISQVLHFDSLAREVAKVCKV